MSRRSSTSSTTPRRSCSAATSPQVLRDASREAARDASPTAARDTSPGSLRDESRGPRRDSSSAAASDASPIAGVDASRTPASDACAWCRGELVATAPEFQRFCSKRCRQSAWRLRCQVDERRANALPKRLAYADPPYPGKAHLYKDQASYGGEVDHRALIASLVDGYDGWALSTSAAALQDVLELCPRGVRVCPWVKPRGVSSKGNGMQNAWEPLIVWPARELRPGFRDYLKAHAARGGGTLIGRKPLKFCGFLFRALGALPGDSFADLFPGSGVVSDSWREFSRRVTSPATSRGAKCEGRYCGKILSAAEAARSGYGRGLCDSCFESSLFD